MALRLSFEKGTERDDLPPPGTRGLYRVSGQRLADSLATKAVRNAGMIDYDQLVRCSRECHFGLCATHPGQISPPAGGAFRYDIHGVSLFVI